MIIKEKSGLLSLFWKFSSGTWITAIIGFLTIPLTTRLIIPGEFGKATIFVLSVNLLSRICLVGSDQGLVRKYYEVNHRNRSKLLWSSLFVPVVASLLLLIPLLIFWKLISIYLLNDLEFSAIILLAITLLIQPFFLLALQILRMANKAKEYSFLNILKASINVGTIIFYAKYIKPDFYSIVWGTLLSSLLTFLVAMILEKKIWFSKIRIVIPYVKELFVFGVPFIPTFIFMWLMEAMDKFALAELSNFEEVGIYAAAFKIVGVLMLLKVGFQNFWIPVSLDYYENKKNAQEFFSKTADFLIPIFFLIISIFLFLSSYIVILLGKDYRSAEILIPLLIFIPLATFIREITGRGIDFSKKTYWHIFVTFIAALVNLIGNFLLIPKFGSKGAAIATGVSYIIYLGIISIISNSLYYFKYRWDKLISLTILLFSINILILFQSELGLENHLILTLKFACICSVLIIYFKNFLDLKSFLSLKIKATFL